VGLILQVGTNRRFDPGVAFAWRFIQAELGQLMALKAWYCDSIHRYTMTDNLQPLPVTSAGAKRPPGNPKADKRRYFMLTHGSHLVDMARFLGGELVSVQARLVERFGAYCWFVAVEFANGTVGHLDLTLTVRGDFEEGFRVYGEYGSVKGRLYLPWYHKAGEVECFSIKDDLFRRPLGQDSYTYKLQIEGFADTILHGKPLFGASVEDGLAGMRAMAAIARSVETGEVIRLAEVTGGV
jgi:predicted dehydrogenase